MQLTQHPVDSAYDPVHDVYLVVGEDQSSAQGVFVDAVGHPLGAPFRLPTSRYFCCISLPPTFAGFNYAGGGPFRPRVTYAADLNDGAGGQGAFLVLWTESSCDPARCSVPLYRVLGSIVAYPERVIGGRNQPSIPGVITGALPGNVNPWAEVSVGMAAVARAPALAYSSASHVFLVAHEQAGGLAVSLLDANGLLMPKPPTSLDVGAFSSLRSKFLVTWNSVMDEFGLFYPNFRDTTTF